MKKETKKQLLIGAALVLELLFLLLSILLISPFSQDYFNFVLMGGYYIPHIAIEFAALGLNEMYHESNGRKKWLSLAGSVILAVLAGMGGTPNDLGTVFPTGACGAGGIAEPDESTTRPAVFLCGGHLGLWCTWRLCGQCILSASEIQVSKVG